MHMHYRIIKKKNTIHLKKQTFTLDKVNFSKTLKYNYNYEYEIIMAG